MFNFNLTPLEKISKSKIALYKRSPFFSYLVENLNIQEREDVGTCGVTGGGDFFFSPTYVESLNDDTMLGVLCHEVLHLAYEHPMRGKGREIMVGNISLWNIACDIAVNNSVVQNEFTLPKEGLIPENDSVTVFGYTVKDVDSKCSEEIYEELKAFIKGQVPKKGKGNKSGKGTPVSDSGNEFGFDKHEWSDNEGKPSAGKKGGKIPSSGNAQGPQKDWRKILNEAYAHSKLRGTEPSGVEREAVELHKSRLNWRSLLRREIAKAVPYDISWSRPNKKYIWSGLYLPSTTGEMVKVLISIDTSGSMSSSELADVKSEIIGIARSYNGVEFRILTHDVDVHDDYKLYNGNVNKLKNLALHGGGGTSHSKLYEYIKKKRYNEKILISFTDGCSDIGSVKQTRNTLFILVGNHVDPAKIKPYGSVISISR